MTFNYQAACISRTGKIRDDNEDNFLFNGKCLTEKNSGLKSPIYCESDTQDVQIFAVFDGMGGEDRGELAANTASRVLRSGLKSLSRKAASAGDLLEQSVCKMNRAVFEKGCSVGARQIGTTAAILYCYLEQLYVCNVGDSRIYRFHRGKLQLLTIDDTTNNPNVLNQQLTQFIGVDEDVYTIEPHIKKGEIIDNDIYLICSDGLYNMVSEKEIKKIISENSKDVAACVKKLSDKAEANGGEDNCTVVVVKFQRKSLTSRFLYGK